MLAVDGENAETITERHLELAGSTRRTVKISRLRRQPIRIGNHFIFIAVKKLSSMSLVDVNEGMIHFYARLASVKGVQRILSNPNNLFSVNEQNVWGQTPLHVALYQYMEAKDRIPNLVAIIVTLLDHGANILEKDNHAMSPLQLTAKMVPLPATIVHRMYLALTSKVKTEEVLPTLLQNGWKIEMFFFLKNAQFVSEIMQLCPETVTLSDGTKKNQLLHQALEVDCGEEILKVLIDNGLDVNSSFCGRTPLHVAAITSRDGSHYNLMVILLNAGANPNVPDYKSLQPIDYILETGDTKIFQLLLDVGCTVSNHILSRALHQASLNGYISIMEHFVTTDSINSRYKGVTPLHLAARYHRAPAVYYLLAMGADVNAADHIGLTALHHTIHGVKNSDHGKVVPIIGLLLHFGADIERVCRANYTALYAALHKRNKFAVFQLVRHCAIYKSTRFPYNETLINHNSNVQNIFIDCMTERNNIDLFSSSEKRNYASFLGTNRKDLLDLATGVTGLDILEYQDGLGLKLMDGLNFNPANFPYFGSYFMTRIHLANIELITLKEIAQLNGNVQLISKALARIAHEFVQYFSLECLIGNLTNIKEV